MRPAAKVVILIAGAIVATGFGLVTAVALNWGDEQSLLAPAAVATALCLSTAVATLLLAEAVFQRAPQLGPVAILLGTGMRMAVAVVGVTLLGELLAQHGTPRDRFAGWVTYLYIVTLAIECGLLMSGAARIDARAQS